MPGINIQLQPRDRREETENRRRQFESVYMDRLLYGGHNTEEVNKLKEAYTKTGSIPNTLDMPGEARREVGPQIESPLPSGGTRVEFPTTEVVPTVDKKPVNLTPRMGGIPVSEEMAVQYGLPAGTVLNPSQFLRVQGDMRGGKKYGKDQLDAIMSGDPQKLLSAFPEGVPSEALLRAGQYSSERGRTARMGAQDERFDRTQSANLRTEFINRPEVKDFVAVATQVKSMDALLKSALDGNMKNKLALDQGLITMYNKLTDPNSVVRESEYARTPENIPTINRIVGAIAKVEAGGAGLTDEDRAALVVGAKIIANERGRTYQATREGYEKLAPSLNADPSAVTGTLPTFKEFTLNEIPSVGKVRVSNGQETLHIYPSPLSKLHP